jgi:hypothetical protein
MLISLVFASAAAAAVQPGAASALPAPPVKERKICRSEYLIGSVTPKRTCKTKAEWNALMGRKSGQDSPADEQRAPRETGKNSN